MKEQVRALKSRFDSEIAAAAEAAAIEKIRNTYLGRKGGELSLLLRSLKNADPAVAGIKGWNSTGFAGFVTSITMKPPIQSGTNARPPDTTTSCGTSSRSLSDVSAGLVS